MVVIAVTVCSYNHYFITSTIVIAVIVGSFYQYIFTSIVVIAVIVGGTINTLLHP
jgi:hypothetical protein